MVRIALVLSVLGFGACGDDGSPSPHDASIDAASDAMIDAASVCTVANECPCFSNDDCPPSTRCHAADEDNVYCTPGARGTGVAGSTCAGEDDCESALCVDGTDVMRCSKICNSNPECPAELPRCLAGIGICARAI